MALTAAIEVYADETDAQTLWVRLRITNPTEGRIEILNPDMGVPSPAINWPFSPEAYQTFLLLSFGFLTMAVTDEAGQELPRKMFLISVTPALRPPLELGPGDSFDVTIPIGDFYQLERNKTYSVALEYGDRKQKVSARASFAVP
jgi:hypothetical protein